MANLARPVNLLAPVEERIIEFKGLNRTHTVNEGEMSDMLNMSPDSYPILTQRKLRGNMALPEGVVKPIRLMAKFGKIALIGTTNDDELPVAFCYDGEIVDTITDLSESTRMVAINTKICFFPEKEYVEIAPDGTVGDVGSLDANVTLTSDTSIDITTGEIALPKGLFKYDDAIDISGKLAYTPSGGTATTMDITVSCIIESVIPGGENDTTDQVFLPVNTFIEIVGTGATGVALKSGGTISRFVPDIDHVAEWNNRLWGASNDDNTIYACKLGDPTNWHYYQGTSMDSYYAQQGTDGEWTGVGLYSNHLIFFKQDSMCRVYGTAPSNYQVTNTEVFGVEKGSRQSVVTINDTVFYKSKIGIMAYSGGTPYCISDKLNTECKAVVAGTEKRKYYASVQKKSGGYELLVFDTDKGLWHKEDSTRFRSCATINNRLYYVEYDTDILVCSTDLPCSSYLLVGGSSTGGRVGIANPASATEDFATMRWEAVFGPFDEYLEEHKIYSKLAMRLIATGDCSARVYIAIDDEKVTLEEYCTPIDMTVTNGSITNGENAYTDESSDTYATVPDTVKANEKWIKLYFPSLEGIPDDAEIISVEAKLGARYNAANIAQTVAYLCDSSGDRKSRNNWSLFRPHSGKQILNLINQDYTLSPSSFKSTDGSNKGCYIAIGDSGTSRATPSHLTHYIYGASLKVTYKTKWQKVEEYEHVSTKGDFIPIIPRRCDRYSVKIEGRGPCEVKTLTRRVRQGSFGRL